MPSTFSLGGGVKGISPHPVSNGTLKGSSELETTRFTLRNAWNGLAASKNYGGRADATGIPSATCNTKFVYDSSDYIRFRKQMAVNRNYNDAGFGGANNAAQSAIRAIRR